MAADEDLVLLRVLASPRVEAPLVPIPAGTEMVLREFRSGAVVLGDFESSRVRLDVLADGAVIAEVPPTFDRDRSGRMRFRFESRFASGVLVRGGEKVTLRFDGPALLAVNVGALIQEAPS